jgi:acetyl esterase/lipase
VSDSITERELTYKTIGDVALRAHIFAPLERATAPRSAIVYFFGGGWVGGAPSQFFPHCRHLASRGMVAVSAEYRVRNTHGTTPSECVTDGKSAVRWLRAHAGEMGVDPSRVAAGGGSAGGHVAACTALVPGLDELSEDLGISSVPDALLLFNPVVDATFAPLAERFGGRGAELSPRHHVRHGCPPTLIFHGVDDQTVPYVQVVAFCEAMQASGNVCEVIGFEGKGHGFFNYGRDDNTAFTETLRHTDRFFAALAFLADTPD